MNFHPLVTIGIPNFNYSRYILLALESIIIQDYENIEVIIVDDCSTDNSVQVIEHWISNYNGKRKISFTRNPRNLGLTKVCNILLNQATGKYFQPLDADDVLLPGKISSQVALLENDTGAAFIYSDALVIDENGNISEESYLARIRYDKDRMPVGSIHEQLMEFNFVCLPTVLVNTAKARAVGGFDESLQVQDYFMWLKLAENHLVLYLNSVTAKYRVHANSMGQQATTNARSEDSILTTKYRYYPHSSAAIKRVVRQNIQNSSVYLFQQGYPTARKWVRVAFILNPGVKTFFYFIVTRFGLGPALVNKVKKWVGKSRFV